MQAPPPYGDIYDTVPAGATNPGLTGCWYAWDTMTLLAGAVIDQATTDLYLLQGIGGALA